MIKAIRAPPKLLRLPFRALSTHSGPRGPRGILRKRPPPAPRLPPRPGYSPARAEGESLSVGAVSGTLKQSSESQENSLLSPVYIPEDPHGVLTENHPAFSILANSSIVVQRQLEMMNVLIGFEQANRYIIMDPQGNHIGFLAEQELGFGHTIARQLFRTHRSFTAHVFDKHEREVLRFHRPFSWISSRIRVYDTLHKTVYRSSPIPDGASISSTNQASAQISTVPLSQMRIVGEAQQQWAPLRRKYNLFLARTFEDMDNEQNAPQLIAGELPLSDPKAEQVAEDSKRELGMMQFAYVNEPFLSWDFTLLSSDDKLVGSVNRNFVGFAREIFTDTGVYALRMDAAGLTAEPRHLISQTAHCAQDSLALTPGMTLDQRAVMLATAVSIDFDYFSRHSGSGGGFMPLWFPMGGEFAAGSDTGGAAEAGAGAIGGAARGSASVGMSEGAISGAGTIAGYEAMRQNQRDDWRSRNNDSSSLAGAEDSHNSPQSNPETQTGNGGESWSEERPWQGKDGDSGRGQDQPGEEEIGGGVAGGDWFDSFFS